VPQDGRGDALVARKQARRVQPCNTIQQGSQSGSNSAPHNPAGVSRVSLQLEPGGWLLTQQVLHAAVRQEARRGAVRAREPRRQLPRTPEFSNPVSSFLPPFEFGGREPRAVENPRRASHEQHSNSLRAGRRGGGELVAAKAPTCSSVCAPAAAVPSPCATAAGSGATGGGHPVAAT
jgi:hypothetical protein